MLINPSTFIWPQQVFLLKKPEITFVMITLLSLCGIQRRLCFQKIHFYCRFSFFCLSLIISVSVCSKFVLVKVIDLPEMYLVCSFLHEPINDGWQ